MPPPQRGARAVASASLGPRLDALYRDFNQADAIADPVNLVRRFASPPDREVAGFCAAALAFGRVASVNESIETVFGLMGPSPAAFIRSFEPRIHGAAFSSFVHRWTRGPDIVALLWVLRQMLESVGIDRRLSLRRATTRPHRTSGRRSPRSPSGRWRSTCEPRTAVLPQRPGVCYFFPRPAAGSACKRLESLPAMDGAAGCRRPRRVDAHRRRHGSWCRSTRT